MVSAEQKLKTLGITLPSMPMPLGAYEMAVQADNLLFLTGMLSIKRREPKFIGKLGKELNAEAGREAARMAALNALAVVRKHLGSLDKVKCIVRTSFFLAVSNDFIDHPIVADGASELFRDVFGADRLSVRSVVGVVSLPLNTPVEIEVTFEVILESAPYS